MASLSSTKPLTGESVTTAFEKNFVHRQTIEQTMEKLPNGARRLAAQLRTPIPAQFIWSVLTDYDHLSDFIPNLKSSELLSREGNRVHLKQVGSQQIIGFTFSAQVQIELIEDQANGTLTFKLIQGDFRRFEGSWQITELPNKQGTCLLYELTVQGCIGMPVSLIEKRLRQDLTSNLLAVEKTSFFKQEYLEKQQQVKFL